MSANRRLAMRRPNLMDYPSGRHTRSSFALDNNDLTPSAQVDFTTLETLSAQAREVIEAARQCRTWNG